MNRVEIFIEIEFVTDAAAQRTLDQRGDSAYDLARIDELRLDGLLSREGKQLLDELGTVLGRLASRFYLLIMLWLLPQFVGRV